MTRRFAVILRVVTLLCAFCCVPAYSASDFDGSTSRVEVTYSAPLGSTAFSVGCWTRREGDGEGGSTAMILNKKPGGVDEDWQFTSEASVPSYRVTIAFTGGVISYDVARPAVDTPVHTSFTYAGTTADPIIYFDAVPQSVTPTGTASGSYITGTGNLTIGDRVTADRSWDGQLAECFYYNRALSANEIVSIACRGSLCGVRSVPRGLIAYWPLGVFSGRNHTSTASLSGTATGLTVLNNGPPIAYSSQGDPP